MTETLRKGGIEKFPASAFDWLVADIEAKLEADGINRIRKFITPALIAKAVSHSYSKRASRVPDAPPAVKPAPMSGAHPIPPHGSERSCSYT